MPITKGDVLAYLQSLSSPSQINHRFVMGQMTVWQGQINGVQQDGVPDDEIPPIVAATGLTPGLIGASWGEESFAEDGPHWGNPGASIGMRDAIAGLKAYWDAGCLITVGYLPASMIGPTSATSPAGTFLQCIGDPPPFGCSWGRYDPTPLTPPYSYAPLYFPMNIANLCNPAGSTADCAQWRQGVLYTGQTYKQIVDYTAAYLKQLTDHGVVVIFSPWHEADSYLKGYGTNRSYDGLTPAEFITLWRFWHDYLTGVMPGSPWAGTTLATNLIWHWSLLAGDSASYGGMAYYAGDAYVDIVGWSSYTDASNPLVGVYQPLVDTGKPVMFGEFGWHVPDDGPPYDLNTWVESTKAHMPKVVGGMSWAGAWALQHQSNLAVGMANPWVQNAPVPILQLPPVASFVPHQVPGTLTIQFEDTSI